MIENDVNGLLVAPENSLELSQAISRLAVSETLRAQMGQAARDRVLKAFSIEREVQNCEALYEEILSTKAIHQKNEKLPA